MDSSLRLMGRDAVVGRGFACGEAENEKSSHVEKNRRGLHEQCDQQSTQPDGDRQERECGLWQGFAAGWESIRSLGVGIRIERAGFRWE